ncbi:MAG TPA: methyltransferase domain-containing protein [Puia sp.]|jgi:hypothetical protein|nr:methyltransferase domain-containing protein [Puia sp.]
MTNPPADSIPPPRVPHPASFRDPAGFVFTIDDVIYRQVNRSYAELYEQLMKSGLYAKLTHDSFLIPHTEAPDSPIQSPNPDRQSHYKTLLPRKLSRLSYPGEWCPAQLRDAALLTLKIQRLAMEYNMTMKDATPFNIQFDNGSPIFIDTLSFDLYDPAKPWIAYRQFCECFLFPLYLHRYTQTGTGKISTAWPDGIPVPTTARLLPLKSRWNAGVWLHVFLQNHVGSRQPAASEQNLRFSKAKLSNLIEHLQSIVTRLNPAGNNRSAWSNYYDETILGKAYLEEKERLFRQYLDDIEFADALDLGCNDGWFSKILTKTGAPVIAVDSDCQCIDKLYRDRNPNILPLCVDLTNPTPATGFQNTERASFTDRAPSDLVTALALVHHLALHNNIPLSLIADYLSQLAKKYLIIEFIPLSDPKATELIARKQSPTIDYDAGHFESAFGRDFRIQRKDQVPGTERLLYLLKKI